MGLSERIRGKASRRVQCDFIIHGVFNLLPGSTSARVSLKCSNKTVETKAVPVMNGEAEFRQTLKLITTLYMSSSKVSAKNVELLIKEVASGKEVVQGAVTLNIADFVPARTGEAQRVTPEIRTAFRRGARELPTHLDLSVRTRWVGGDEVVPAAAARAKAVATPDGDLQGLVSPGAAVVLDAPKTPGDADAEKKRLRTPKGRATPRGRGGMTPGEKGMTPGMTPRGSPRAQTLMFTPKGGKPVEIPEAGVQSYSATETIRVTVGKNFLGEVHAINNYGTPMRLRRDDIIIIVREPRGGELPDVHLGCQDPATGRWEVGFTLQQPGVHTLHLMVDGKIISNDDIKIEAILGATQHEASECILAGEALNMETASSGAHAQLYVQSRLFDYGQLMSGKEKLSVTIVPPSGTTAPALLSFEEGRFNALLFWPEVGTHKVSAQIRDKTIAGSPFFVNVVAQQMSLPLSRMFGDGLHTAVAGKTADFTITARDCHGSQLATKDAKLGVLVEEGRGDAGEVGETVTGAVVAKGNGVYHVTYKLARAGAFQLVITHQGTSVRFNGMCEPGPTHIPHCTVQCDPVTGQVRSSEQALFTIVRRDKEKNLIVATQGLTPFTAKVSGPGKAEVQIVDTLSGACNVHFCARTAGKYRVHLFGGKARELLPGSPFTVTISADALAIPSVQVTPVAPLTLLAPKVVGAEETLMVEAGATLAVELEARDAHSNLTGWDAVDPTAVTGVVRGAGGITVATLAGTIVSNRTLKLSGMVTVAGCYTVALELAGQMLTSWPKVLQVVPSKCDPMRCRTVLSRGKDSKFAAKAVAYLRVQTTDRFGNALVRGGATVEGWLRPARGGSSAVTVKGKEAVHDHGDGSYTLELRPPSAGTWEAAATVAGMPAGDVTTFVAEMPPTSGGDFSVIVGDRMKVGASQMTVDMGTASRVRVRANEPLMLPESTAAHAFSLTLVSPTGVLTTIDLPTGEELPNTDEPETILCWYEAGIYHLHVFFTDKVGRHDQLTNSPVTITVLKPRTLDSHALPQSARLGKGRSVASSTTGGDSTFVGNSFRVGCSASSIAASDFDTFPLQATARYGHPLAITPRGGADDGASPRGGLVTFAPPPTSRYVATPVAGKVGAAPAEMRTTHQFLLDSGAVKVTLAGAGASRCVAGEPTSFQLNATQVARAAAGNMFIENMTLMVELELADGTKVPAEVTAKGGGKYTVGYLLTAAGTHNMLITICSHGSNKLSATTEMQVVRVKCRPGKVDFEQCVLDQSELPGTWIVGEWACVVVVQRDAFGNMVPDNERVPIDCVGHGPGPVASRVHEGNTYYQVEVGGDYVLDVHMRMRGFPGLFGRKKGKSLPGSPIKIKAFAAPPSAMGSLLVLRSNLEWQPEGPLNPGEVVTRAGEQVIAEVICRDKFGNIAEWEPDTVLTIVGYDIEEKLGEIQFEQKDMGNSHCTFSTVLTKAGTYNLLASMDDMPIGAGFSTLQVVAGPLCVRSCELHGLAIQDLKCNQPYSAHLLTKDAYGNASCCPEDEVFAHLVGFAGVRAPVDMPDSTDAMRPFTFSVPSPGQWELEIECNGQVVDQSVSFTARCEIVDGRHCMLVEPPPEEIVCGVAEDIEIQLCTVRMQCEAADGGALEGTMSGSELVVVMLTTPTGAQYTQPAVLLPDKTGYLCSLTLLQEGSHRVEVLVNNHPVQGSPFTIQAVPQEPYLPHSVLYVNGAPIADHTCHAGEEQTVVMACCDCHGNACGAGWEARLLICRLTDVKGAEVATVVEDMRDGSHRIKYTLSVAGAYQLELSAGPDDPENVIAVDILCVPGPLHIPSCTVDGRRLQASWVAGMPAVVTVTRCDAHGNAVSHELFAPAQTVGDDVTSCYAARAAGPGPVSSQVVEVGDGSLEVRLIGRVPGSYEVTVTHSGVPLSGCPLTAKLSAGSASESSCITSVAGIVMSSGELFACLGERLVIDVEPRDRFGNPTKLEVHQQLRVHVTQHGAASGPLPEFVRSVEARMDTYDVSGEVQRFTGFVATAGKFTLWLHLDERVVAGWPHVISVRSYNRREAEGGLVGDVYQLPITCGMRTPRKTSRVSSPRAKAVPEETTLRDVFLPQKSPSATSTGRALPFGSPPVEGK